MKSERTARDAEVEALRQEQERLVQEARDALWVRMQLRVVDDWERHNT